ncbi:hemolysin family protein [Dactylosporangium sp. AC04546]|uniref:hemolysin family protein n=1 Tax=Dactylosporangium sp. AC04546 TaxID=2862460 RepID=UPI001EDE11AB|nr:hemolysin family protein [Dactylosporangium sp. AC04546]WVK89584.1 hemolysin family protein [Dactylosporangium sp. AC04546]
MLILIGLVLIIALTAATAYFVAQEFAYVAVDRGALRQAADGGDRAAARALQVTERLSFMLSGAQLGITVTALLAGYVAEPYLGEGLAALLGSAGVPRAASLSVSVVVALLVATVVQMVLGELAPKNLAITKPGALARWLSGSTLMYLTVAGPLIRIFDAAATRLLRRAGIEPVEELPQGATREDLERIVADAHDRGDLDVDTARLLDSGLEFRNLSAGSVMVPRVDVVTVRADEPASRLVQLLPSGHSRFPVIGAGVDDVTGIVSVTDVLTLDPDQRDHTPVSKLAAPPLVVPASAMVTHVLEQLRSERRQLAIVADEYGGFAGVISLEDIAEELVGQIHDEDDLPELGAERQPDGSWLVPGRWRLDQIAVATGVRFPANPLYDTVSGLMMYRLGRILAEGDHVDLSTELGPDVPAQPTRLTAVSVHRHVAATVHIAVGQQP